MLYDVYRIFMCVLIINEVFILWGIEWQSIKHR